MTFRRQASVESVAMTRFLRSVAGLSMAASLLACASGPRPAAVDLVPGTATPMRPGEHARLPDNGVLAYVGVRSDSRCPPDVTCIHAGWVELDFTHQGPAGARRAIVLSTHRPAVPVEAGGWRFTIDDVGRGASPVAHVRASDARN